MKTTFTYFMMVAAILGMLLTGCKKDDPDVPNNPDNDREHADYGQLKGNLICVGKTRKVTYTSAILLGTVDFPKITSNHTYGIVFMPAMTTPNFDYEGKLLLNGRSDKYDKEEYVCTSKQINSSATDGKFEKELVHLMPATTYYYRAYVAIGQNVNYSSVATFTTLDPSQEMTISTSDVSALKAVCADMNGIVNVGNLRDVNEDQKYGFIFTDAKQMATAETLTYEWYKEWTANHFETEEDFDKPSQVTTSENMNGRITCNVDDLIPGVTYYCRSFFYWNGKYFYSPDVKTFKTVAPSEIEVGMKSTEKITANSATLNGTVAYTKIGIDRLDCGFMISKDYSNASEFDMNSEEIVPWSERYSYPKAKIFYVETETDKRDFQKTISGLTKETVYYVRPYVELVEVEKKDKDGSIKKEMLYSYGNVEQFKTIK